MGTQVREQNTSQIARQKFLVDGKLLDHHKIILKTLKKFPSLSNWGISQNSKLSYHQVGRRTGELREQGLITEVTRMRDADGAIRTQYTLV